MNRCGCYTGRIPSGIVSIARGVMICPRPMRPGSASPHTWEPSRPVIEPDRPVPSAGPSEPEEHRARQSQSPDRAAVTSRRCEDGVGRRGDSRRGAPCPSIGVPRAVRAGGGRRRHHAQVRQRVPQRRRCALPFGSRHAGRRCRRVVDPARRGRGSRRRQGAPPPMTVKGSVLELIGNTPMVDISELSPNPDVRILIKLEGQNPGGSVKDRIALSMIEEAEKDGVLKPGQTLIEPSSGNTGIGMALICQVKGYHLKVVLATNVSIERRQLLEVWGAEIIESPGAEGSNGAVKRARALAADHPEWVFLYQYANPANPKAHYEGTGPEIWRDCPEVTHFVAGLGTSGTLLGAGRFLKEQNPDVKVWAIEPPAGGSMAHTLTSGFCSFRNRPAPSRVPDVPSPATKWVTSGQSRQISGPVPS